MIALAIRVSAGQIPAEKERLDIAAFILANLRNIAVTIDQAATAWEKRDYWVKADQFRMQWKWVERISSSLEQLIRSRNWEKMAELVAELAGKISLVEPPKRIPNPPPWEGAWEKQNIP